MLSANKTTTGIQNTTGLPDVRYLTVKQAASYMNISKEYLYALARARRIRHVKIGAKTLFAIQDVENFLKSKTVEPEEQVSIKNGYKSYTYSKQDADLIRNAVLRATMR
jgi:excisionase family DNA binding protein